MRMVLGRRELLALPLPLLGLGLGLCLTRAARAAEGAPLIVLQPLGAHIPPAELAAVSAALGAFYAVRIETRAPLGLPTFWWSKAAPKRV